MHKETGFIPKQIKCALEGKLLVVVSAILVEIQQ